MCLLEVVDSLGVAVREFGLAQLGARVRDHSVRIGIVFNTPTNPDDSPKMIATVEKLTGNVDTDKLLAAAPDEVTNLPGYAGYNSDDVKRGTLGGFPASRFSRSYTKNGVPRLFFQNTVVVEGKDGAYLLQLKAEGPDADAPALSAAELVIVQKTTITP